MTPMVIKNPLVMQYEGLDFRERIGEEWPQEELGLCSSGMIGPRGRDTVMLRAATTKGWVRGRKHV